MPIANAPKGFTEQTQYWNWRPNGRYYQDSVSSTLRAAGLLRNYFPHALR